MLSADDTRTPDVTTEQQRKLALLLDLGALIAREVNLDELLTLFEQRVARALDADRATLWLLDARTGRLRTRVANLPELAELTIPVGHGIAGHVAASKERVNIGDVHEDPRWNRDVDKRTGYRTSSVLCVPVLGGTQQVLGVVQVLNKVSGTFSEEDERVLIVLAEQIARALEYTSLGTARGQRGLNVRGRFNHIVGESPAMEAAYHKVLRAAETDATVLLHGETGTGKGLFARAIHVNSRRADGPFVHIDTTALPSSLVESELFGHEQGAYTGADRTVPGKVELADGGTLFLDEIDAMSVGMQAKLLRFLQERRFERVGGRETRDVDVRLVIATNRNLEDQVAEGRFRSDLYYRIRVIDIELPPLRDRGPGDVLALADHFLDGFTRRYEKPDLAFTNAARDALARHRWPGNVRELEHAVERAVVLASGRTLDAEALGLVGRRAAGGAAMVAEDGLTLEVAIRRYVRSVLDSCGGNQSAAARALGIGRNRLARLLRKS